MHAATAARIHRTWGRLDLGAASSSTAASPGELQSPLAPLPGGFASAAPACMPIAAAAAMTARRDKCVVALWSC